ncbi:DegT/DnrJ/EryC1/StrS family aminotransferase [Pedobacter nyackensis]|uniref:dTDP-4-amino-4,6-dideoxygalactose transaminase n=1 Tax=Pedobacter nyackensis TaxID=475255 RepID=A0A1W2C2U2_9SPHI|nr:DegT/DnrJ/EryC1/StrS family aminotransferase [Pedobacter nyackensis]SMC79028.1 dTDP-4-amino-4,6-dideoxygalactose transaminase [Pedobacter nyackensis]
MIKRNIPIGLPSMGIEEWEACRGPIESGWITQGPKVKEFETNFAKRHQVKHAFAVSNCTTALHLALVACGVEPGDEVIVPAFTWVSTANAVKYCHATPVFVDIDINTFNIDINKIAEKITAKTKAIIPVHLFGLCADTEEIRKRFPQLMIVEDGACAAGSALNGKPAGGLGDVGCFSFHPRKSVTTGEGGMLTTDNDEIAVRLDRLRNHGASISEEQRHHGPKPYILSAFEMVGYNYRMTDIQGAIGVVQLGKLDLFIDERQKWAEYYAEELKDIAWLKTPEVPKGYKHGWQSYVTYIDESISPLKRNDIMELLQQKGISTRPGTHAVHMLDVYAKMYGIKPEDFPEAFKADQYSMSIPMHNKMVKEDFEYIVEALKSIQ